MTNPADSALIAQAMSAYALGTVKEVSVHAGTAAKTWRVITDSGAYLLRTRGSRSASSRMIAYDHALRNHLLQKGIPTAAPLETHRGTTVTRVGDLALEVYALIPGKTLQQANTQQLAAAGSMLARFHRATHDFRAAQDLPPVAQYRTLGLDATSARMEDPRLLRTIYTRLRTEDEQNLFRGQLTKALEWLDRIEDDLDNKCYKALPHTVTHGDFTLANILFSDARITGVFDFDWARWAPRVRDIADGMFFIAGRRRTALDPADIWSLTEAVDLDVSRCTEWLRSYGRRTELLPEELAAIPLALAARWLSVRVEGMAKVAPDRTHEFALANIAGPLDWLSAHWDHVAHSLRG